MGSAAQRDGAANPCAHREQVEAAAEHLELVDGAQHVVLRHRVRAASRGAAAFAATGSVSRPLRPSQLPRSRLLQHFSSLHALPFPTPITHMLQSILGNNQASIRSPEQKALLAAWAHMPMTVYTVQPAMPVYAVQQRGSTMTKRSSERMSMRPPLSARVARQASTICTPSS